MTKILQIKQCFSSRNHNFASSIGTIVGIILTFGTSAVIQRCEKEESEHKAALLPRNYRINDNTAGKSSGLAGQLMVLPRILPKNFRKAFN